MTTKRFLYGLLVAALGANLLFGTKIYFQNAVAAEKDDPYPNLKLFSLVLEHVRQDYVEGDKLTYQDLIYGAMKGMLSSLDPHSEFMEPPKYNDLKSETQGEFGGVGIVISAGKDGSIIVVAPMEDTPGFKAGIQAGDRIVKIDGRTTERMNLQEAVKRMRGEAGPDVTLTLQRPATGVIKDYKLTRAAIKVDTVKDLSNRREFPVDAHKIGYLRMTQFGEQTVDEFEAALKKLDKNGMKALVFDLRNNPGGLLDTAVKVVEKFVPRGTLIVSTEGRDTKQKVEYRATGGQKYSELPVVVLVNEGSASASEIVSGALQDLTAKGKCRAVILGEQTFGKGSVQSILPLQDGSALRLTTAKYYTPSHKVIHEHGITPDIVVPMSYDEERDVTIKRTPGALDAQPEEDQDRIRSAHDPQLERALDLLKGLSIYSNRLPPPIKPGRSDKVAMN